MLDYAPAKDAESLLARAVLELVAKKGLQGLNPATLAQTANVSIATVRSLLPEPRAVLPLVLRWVDNETLIRFENEDYEQLTIRERLFDLLVTRMEILQPYKAAVEIILTPLLYLYPSCSNLHALGSSIGWLLVAAGIHGGGSFFHRIAMGIVVIDITRIWLLDPDPDMAQFTARLDRHLARLEQIALKMSPCQKKSSSSSPLSDGWLDDETITKGKE